MLHFQMPRLYHKQSFVAVPEMPSSSQETENTNNKYLSKRSINTNNRKKSQNTENSNMVKPCRTSGNSNNIHMANNVNANSTLNKVHYNSKCEITNNFQCKYY